MKKVILSVALIAAIGFTSCKSESKDATTKVENTELIATTDASFGVRGNCGMCKTTIEKAANSVSGVAKATWDKDKKKMDVSFDATKTDSKAVEAAIANSGYDTENVMGNIEAYDGLPGCCKYDHEMKMNQIEAVKTKDAH
jgi:periplasmic mercuric ion binding protein